MYSATKIFIVEPLHPPMRAAPTLSLSTLDSPNGAWFVGNTWSPAVTGTLTLVGPQSTIDGFFAPLEGFSGLTLSMPVAGYGSVVWLYASAEI